MWTTIYNDNGKVVTDNSAIDYFFDTLKQSYSLAAKIEMLNTDFEPVGSSVTTKCQCSDTNDLQNVITDGSIDVDRSRGTRRTAEFTILNPTAEFTPATGDFDPDGPWVGQIYLNRIIRAWKGLHLGYRHLYVPVGTFMIDIADILVEQNMSIVDITCSDLWKKLSKSYFGRDVAYEDGTLYNTIIRDLIAPSEIPTTGRMAANIDGLGTRDSADRRISKKLKFSEGESRGDKLKDIVSNWGIDAYFDPMGIFVTEDMKNPRDKHVVWRFTSVENDNNNRSGGLVSLRRSFRDDNLYNKVVIVGTGDTKNIVRAVKEDNNPNSKTRIDLIGERVYYHTSDKISTQAGADRALARAWRLRFQLSEEIEANVIVNPALEANDVVRFYEPDFAKLEGNYRLGAFDVPFVTSRQVLKASNIIRSDDL